MAFAALVSLSQILVDVEQQVTDDDDDRHQHQNPQIKSLHEKLCFLQSFMEDYYYAYNNNNMRGERVDPLLEERIREAAYRAEDVIEIHTLNRVRSEGSWIFKYGQMKNLEKRYKKDLQRVNGDFDSIVEEARKMIETNCKDIHETPMIIQRPSLAAAAAGSSSIKAPITVLGFDDDLLEMKARLCGESLKLQIISIVGMGGIGKTTLAKTIFDDPLIAQHFDSRAWITISQEYCMRDTLLGLLTSLNALNNDLSKKHDEILAEHVYKSLKGRRYLIIMDDMWSTKAWDDLRRVLPDDTNGSRVIITTRLSEVAIYADSSSPLHQMRLLNEDQSWRLLQKKVFEKRICPPELPKIGKMIAGKCGGLPLGIVLVAGLLSKVDATFDNWEKFAVNVSSTLAKNDDHLFKIVSLSYNNLPHHLRACFLYMGGFPEDHEIQIFKLTMLWTAEGFLKPIPSKSSEEVAEKYVEDLVKRNLVSITRKRSNGKFRYCRIHDLLRDFCIQKAHDENFLHAKKSGNDASHKRIENKRRLSSSINCSVPSQTSGSIVRSLRFSNNNYRYLTSLAVSCKLLRVLDGPNAKLTCIPAAVTELFHLRYLSFSHDLYVQFVVPARILKLRNLETLIIEPRVRYSLSLHYWKEPTAHLPHEIWKLPKLRHLIMKNCCFCPVPLSTNTNGKVYALNSLQTLSKVADLNFTEDVIQMIPNLKKLGIIYCGNDLNIVTKYHLNNLVHLHQLESLSITCKALFALFPRLHRPFAKNFALPLKLKKLSINCCRLSWINLSMIGRLPNLEVLKLRHTAFDEKEWKLTEGEFLQLKYLLMDSLDVECWQVEHTHFPRLEQLIIQNCWNLKEIPSEIGEITTLQYIEVFSMVESTRDSAIRIQEEQQSLGNESLRVCVTMSYLRVP